MVLPKPELEIEISARFIRTLENASGRSLSKTSVSMVILWLAMSADICVFFVALKVFPSPKQYTVEVLQKWILDYSFSDKESK